MKRGRVWTVVLGLLAAIGAAGIFPVSGADEVDGRLGDITHYNGLVWGDFTSYQAGTEGALAVGGEARIGLNRQGYDIGAAGGTHYHPATQIGKYKNPNDYPSLLLGGDVEIARDDASAGGNYAVYDGPVSMSAYTKGVYDGLNRRFDTKNSLQEVPDSDVANWFESARKQVQYTSSLLGSAHENTVSADSFKRGSYDLRDFENQTLTGTDLKIAVLNVETPNATIKFGEFVLPNAVKDYDIVVINFPSARNVTISGGGMVYNGALFNVNVPEYWYPDQNRILTDLAERVVWNFPLADDIYMENYGVVGSVIAPNADLYAYGGAINGMLIADSFTTEGGMALHAFALNQKIFDLTGEAEVLGQVELVKYDSDEQTHRLEGAQYLLEREDGGWQQFGGVHATDQFGRIRIGDLPAGRYRFLETVAPDGYDLPSGENRYVYFAIDGADDATRDVKLAHFDRKTPEPETSLLVKKVDGTDGEPLGGAGYALYRDLGALLDARYTLVGEYTTGADGTFTMAGLTAGDYYLLETDSPDGYERETQPFHFKLRAADGAVTITENSGGGAVSGNTITLENTPLTQFEMNLLKVDKQSPNTPLEGAAYVLKRRDMDDPNLWHSVPGTWVTDAFGYAAVNGLDDGTYRLYETAAPEGYQLPDVFTPLIAFEVTGGKLAGWSDPAPGYIRDNFDGDTVTIYGQRLVTSIQLAKVLARSDTQLLGAEFALYRIAGRAAPVLVEDGIMVGSEPAVIEGLSEGSYILEEVNAPAHYVRPAGGIPIRIAYEDGALAVYYGTDSTPATGAVPRVIVENEPITGEVSFIKISSAEEEFDNPAGIADAVFRLDYRALEGGRWGAYGDATYTSGPDGRFAIAGLPVGHYRLIEVAVPGGFENPTEVAQTFTILPRGDSTGAETLGEIVITDDPVTLHADMDITKIDRDDETPLAGAHFNLWEVENGGDFDWTAMDRNTIDYSQFELRRVRTDIVSDENGKLDFGEELTAGVYALFESRAPEGYAYFLDYDIEENHNELSYAYTFVFELAPNGDGDALEISWIDRSRIDDGMAVWNGEATAFAITNARSADPTGNVTVVKRDLDTAETLAGADFRLYIDESENDTPLWVAYAEDTIYTTDEDGEIHFADLPLGDYMVEEITAPSGYVWNGQNRDSLAHNRAYFAIAADENGAVADQTVPVNNLSAGTELPHGDALFYKVDGETGEMLGGAQFTLYRLIGGEWVAVRTGITSGENGAIRIHTLPVGDYLLRETTAPEGYDLPDADVPFAVTDDLRGGALAPNGDEIANTRKAAPGENGGGSSTGTGDTRPGWTALLLICTGGAAALLLNRRKLLGSK